ncbi:MAG: gliding motility-associated C-terminal domain-containing protein [Chitinophagaceae bacterium]
MLRVFIISFILLVTSKSMLGQCVTTINTFPYNENFENNNGGWTSGGVNSDWAWGIPNKTIINSAAQGQRCWVIGGLTGSFYSFGQRSYVYSPCFNFTNVQRPFVKMKIWWEGENQYDGTVFQYSLNNGQTWTNVGSNNDPVNCLNQNWFNTANITALSSLASPQQGWSGTILPTQGTCFGGNGSGGWVTAKHCMNNLAGQSSVMFRFAFGAGTICNDFNGFGFDDITISEVPADTAAFTHQCTNTPLQYQFTDVSTGCPNSFSWNFGDPASGAANTSSAQNPNHTFTTPGIYTITLTVQGPCGQSATTTKTIQTLNLNLIATNPTCNDQNGSITATGTNASGTSLYTLAPSAQSNTNGLFNNLAAGQYTVSFSDAANCSLSKSIVLSSPSSATWTSIQTQPVSCFGGSDGGIQAFATGGTGTLNFQLQPGNLNASNGQFNNLSQGVYTITATDASNCILTSIVSITQPNEITWIENGFTRNPCGSLQIGYLTAKAQGGTGNFTYSIFPGGITNSTGNFPIQEGGNYKIVAKDASGCSISVEKQVQVQDCCSSLYIPNAFTPNKDGQNDEFRLVNFFGARIEKFQVYNRYGQAVFTAQHDEDRWDGKFKGMDCEVGTYFYILEYTCLSNGKLYSFKGDISLVR